MIRTDAQSRRPRLGRSAITALAIFAALVLTQLPVSWAAVTSLASNGTIVRCDPLTVIGTTDQTVTVDLYVQDVVNLYGLDLKGVI